ncbi:MAG TPA: APC family permease [Ktedonobacteraceae bacterium]|nr:APC family permease [Ktedonobacteraceae bacterium]
MATKQQFWSPVTGMGQEPASSTESPNTSRRPDALLSEEYTVQTMPKVAGSFGLTGTFVLIIFFITNVPSAIGAGAGTFSFWIVGAITFFIPCVIATAQLGHMFPHEGSLYNWTHRAFGGYMSFFVSFCAWFPCVLLMIVAADVVVGYLQGLSNGTWLVQPWQQGLVLIAILAFSGVLAVQRTATILNVIKVVVVIAFLAVLMVGLAGLIWLMRGHPVDSTLKTATAADWGFAWNPNPTSYYTLALFAFIVQAFLGIEAPLNMGGEMTGPRVVTRHLLWGAVLVLVGYFVVSFGVLVVTGTNLVGNPFALVITVQRAFGTAAGNIVAILILCNFVVTPAVYSYAYARLLLVGGIDQRLPVRIARLNKHRVPINAVIFQTIISIIFAAILFILVPSLTSTANAGTLNAIVYNLVISASTLVWAISTAFLFVDLVKFYIQDRLTFIKLLIFPMPVLWISIILGTISCVASIIGALVFSLIPAEIGNDKWWYIVGGITLACLVVAVVGSMFANSEATWQTFREE